MKICAMSDMHQKLVFIPKCDILAIAGDISLNEDIKWFTEVFIPYLDKYKNKYKKCILVFGNHDDKIHMNGEWKDTVKTLPENIKILTNSSYKYKGIKFFGSPNCKYIPGFINTFTEDKLKELYSKITKGTDVLITHTPPYGICDTVKGDSYHLGSISLMERIREIKPKIHIFGHIHTGKKYLRENGTDYFNVSILDEDYELAYKPTIIRVS